LERARVQKFQKGPLPRTGFVWAPTAKGPRALFARLTHPIASTPRSIFWYLYAAAITFTSSLLHEPVERNDMWWWWQWKGRGFNSRSFCHPAHGNLLRLRRRPISLSGCERDARAYELMDHVRVVQCCIGIVILLNNWR